MQWAWGHEGTEQRESGVMVSLGVQILGLWREAEIGGGCF